MSNILKTDCPLEFASFVIGRKWKLRILWILSQSDYVRFNTLKRELDGITDLMLTKSLKELVSADVVRRVQYNEIPPRVEYSLTQNGVKLIEALVPVNKWSEETLNKFK
ncbi:winged helix-turn-helix transcriptional regulator [Clostridium butyricum]|uniref:winged helix-turn-helix transcriptional regulator n=1 Tax=Clostridium butyricum TaxID=1492 RepID=UPI003D33EEBE